MEFFELKKIISDLLLPIPFFLILGLAGLLRITFIGRGFFSLLGIFFAFAGIFTSAFAPVSEDLLFNLEQKHIQRKEFPPESFLYIIVLGGGTRELEGLSALENLSESSLRRLLEGIRLYKKYPGSRMVFSGHKGTNERSMAEMYSAAAESLGVMKADIDLLVEPKDTEEEARAVKALIEVKKKEQAQKIAEGEEKGPEFIYTLVTSGYHMDRALIEFKRQGLEPIPFAADFEVIPQTEKTWRHYVPRGEHMRKLELYWHETLGSWWQTLRGL